MINHGWKPETLVSRSIPTKYVAEASGSTNRSVCEGRDITTIMTLSEVNGSHAYLTWNAQMLRWKLGHLSYIDVTAKVARGKKATSQLAGSRASDENHPETALQHQTQTITSSEEDDGGDETDDMVVDLPTRPTQIVEPPSYDSLVKERTHSHLEPCVSADQVSSPPNNPVRIHISPTARSESAVDTRRFLSDEWSGGNTQFQSPTSFSVGTVPTHADNITQLNVVMPSQMQSNALRGLPEGYNEDAYLNLREACLLRHFVQNLAPWVSGCLDTTIYEHVLRLCLFLRI